MRRPTRPSPALPQPQLPQRGRSRSRQRRYTAPPAAAAAALPPLWQVRSCWQAVAAARRAQQGCRGPAAALVRLHLLRPLRLPLRQ